MKTYIKYLVFVAVGMFSCEEKLDLTDPQTISEDYALSTDENVKQVLTGAYNELSSGNFYGGNLMRNSELLAANDEIVFSGTYPEPFEIFNKAIVTANGNVLDMWLSGYKTINLCNNVISAIEVVNEDDRNSVHGEALFLRATAYFELVRFFGKDFNDGDPAVNDGVPIILMPTRELDERTSAPRNSVTEVYAAIQDDLTNAISLLSSEVEPTRGSKETAQAMLSRVYLQMGKYAEARDLADAVITSGNYALVEEYEDVFNGGSTKEDIFNIPVSVADGINNMQTFYGATAYGGRGDIEIQQEHLSLYEDGDDRLSLFYIDGATDDTRTGKWMNQYGNVKIIRLAEMMLIRAEANFRLGTTIGDTPLNDINALRARVQLPALDAIELDDILLERRLELAHEGHRIHDVKRLKITLTQDAEDFVYNDNRLVFPVPQREINVNRNLDQNPGYGN